MPSSTQIGGEAVREDEIFISGVSWRVVTRATLPVKNASEGPTRKSMQLGVLYPRLHVSMSCLRSASRQELFLLEVSIAP